MRITSESDYALRIVTALAKTPGERMDAGRIAEVTSVPLRFALKILHKLVKGELVTSVKGAHGGYLLSVAPEKITLKDVIEWIDGPIAIARCLGTAESCSLIPDKTECLYHHIFDSISLDVSAKLQKITIADVLQKKIDLLG